MQNTALVFYEENQQNTTIYRLPNDIRPQQTEHYAHSVLLSLAAYLVWKFPQLPVPSIMVDVKQKYREQTFPDKFATTHSMFDYWAEFLLQQLCNGNALRANETLYFKIKINAEYGQKLVSNGFQSQNVKEEMTWKHVQSNLQEDELRAGSKHKNILIISCAMLKFNRGDSHSVSTIASLYFNNQNWKVFRVLYDQFPSEEQYNSATYIIVPGSHLCISINIEPQVQRLINQLKIVFETNKNLKYLGICYGHQLLSQIINPGSVKRAVMPIVGIVTVHINTKNIHPNLSFLKQYQSINIYSFHSDEVVQIPKGFIGIGSSVCCSIEMMASEDGRFLTIQSHPQYTPSKYRNVVAVNKMVLNDIGKDQFLQILKGNDMIEDQSLQAQQVCHMFLKQ